MKEKDIISVLIPDGENPLLFNVLNCLSLADEVEVYVMSSSQNSPYKFSRFVKKFSHHPIPKNDLEWIENINNELHKYNVDKVLPIFEKGLEILIRHRDLIPKEKLVELPSMQSFKTALNKGLLMRFMDENKIQTSNSIVVKPGERFVSNGKIKYPVLAKPTLDSGGGEGIEKLYNEEEVEAFFKKNKFYKDYLVEEFIEGYDLCCNVLCNDGEILAHTIHKGLMKGQKVFGPSVGLEFLYNDDVLELTAHLMKALKWNGVANLDLRYDQVSKRFKIIEINPRFWYNVDASAVFGVNFPHLYLMSSLGYCIEFGSYETKKYLNINGIMKRVKSNPFSLFNLKSTFKNSQLRFALRDPLPLLSRIFAKSKT
ncbi:ATP-grasp domain-containing protein [Hyunsoonleella rubra]|uniref:ATP-grasp domain-containing protein n=1 Tax=Hyunsoonleella rubra TaxID=1737062 RepID=A0ABW5TBI2_9FLAO